MMIFSFDIANIQSHYTDLYTAALLISISVTSEDKIVLDTGQLIIT
jgi:hypothetical protein